MMQVQQLADDVFWVCDALEAMTCVSQHLTCTGMTHTAGRAVTAYKVPSG